jgi:hypothetical protein
MKNSFILIAALFVASPLFGFAAQDQKHSANSHREVVEFTDRTAIAGVILEGKYLLVHDEEKAPQGEACFYLYKYAGGEPDQLVLSDQPLVMFHCEPVQRTLAKTTVLTLGMHVREAGLFELREVQFAGTAVGHRVVVKTPQP